MGNYNISCRRDVCATPLSVGIFSDANGRIEWQTIHGIADLETRLNSFIKEDNPVPHHGFCMVKCLLAKMSQDFFNTNEIVNVDSEGGFLHDDDYFPEFFGKQLLVLPPFISPLS